MAQARHTSGAGRGRLDGIDCRARLIIKRHWQINTWLTRQKPTRPPIHTSGRRARCRFGRWLCQMAGGIDVGKMNSRRERVLLRSESALSSLPCSTLLCVPRRPRNCVSDMRARVASRYSIALWAKLSEESRVLACVQASHWANALFLPIWARPSRAKLLLHHFARAFCFVSKTTAITINLQITRWRFVNGLQWEIICTSLFNYPDTPFSLTTTLL